MKKSTQTKLKQGAVIALWTVGLIINIATSPPVDPGSIESREGWSTIREVNGVIFLSWPQADVVEMDLEADEGIDAGVVAEDVATTEREETENGSREVLVSSLREEINIDCESTLAAPLDYLKPEMFTAPTLYILEQGEVIPMDVSLRGRTNECRFFTLTSAGLPTTLLSYANQDLSPLITRFEGVSWSELPERTIALDEEHFVISEGTPERFEMSLVPWREKLESEWSSCEQSPRRLSWMIPPLMPSYAKLIGVQEGLDGCHSLLFEGEDSVTLCAPWESIEVLREHQWEVTFMNTSDSFTLYLKGGDEHQVIEMNRDVRNAVSFFNVTPGCATRSDECGVRSLLSGTSPLNELESVPPYLNFEDATTKEWIVAAEFRNVLIESDSCREARKSLGYSIDRITIRRAQR